MMFLGYLLLALALLACFHFVVDGIVAPSEHMMARMSLLRLADKVSTRASKESNPDRKIAAQIVRRSAYNVINDMPRYTLSMLYCFVRDYRTDKAFRGEVSQTMHLIRSSEDEGLRKIRLGIAGQADHVLAWNSMSWSYLLFPLALTVIFFKKLQKIVSAMVTVVQIEDAGTGHISKTVKA